MGLSITPGKAVTKWFFIFAILAALIVGSLSSILSLRTQALVETYPMGEFTQVSTGRSHTCAVADGQAYCWGSGNYGQLGNGATGTSSTPVAVDTSGVLAGKSISQITAGGSHTCAVADGQAYCWGNGDHGRLGNGATGASTTPVAVDTSDVLAGKTISQVVAGYNHSCALADGQAYCWGRGVDGQLGNGAGSTSSTPVAVDTSGVLAGKTVGQVTTGELHSCALADGQAYCWGNGYNGRLGNGASSSSTTPVAVDTSDVLAGKTISQVVAGYSHSCALADGQAYCWGSGNYGQLGNGATGASTTPVAVDTSGVLAGESISQITAGGYHTCALADGQAYCWGRGVDGQLGNGATGASTTPVAVDTSGVLAEKSISQITAGGSHTCAVADSQAYCWGRGSSGQLGNDATGNSSVPVATMNELIVFTPEIEAVSFSPPEDSKTIMTITGDIIGSSFDFISVATDPSSTFLTLNGEPLKWCTDGTGYTETDFPNFPASDDPPCYYLLGPGAASTLITPTEAKVWLPSDFDVTAPGTVSINGSAAFAFNQPTSGGGDEGSEGTPTDNPKPTITVNSKALTATDTPQITKRPTFTGTATPGATVTVTVYSDPVSCTTTADMDGNWSCTLPTDLPPGDHTVIVHITNPDNTTEQLGPYKVTVPGNATLTNLLAPNTGLQRLQQTLTASPSIAMVVTTIVTILAIAAAVTGVVVYKRRRV